MGSKRWMLSNGLGELVSAEAAKAGRFVDLFSGSAAVSWHVATKVDVPVLSVDLQTYSAVLAGAVVLRTRGANPSRLLDIWLEGTGNLVNEPAVRGSHSSSLSRARILRARRECATAAGAITRAYGGHYFSPAQARAIDALLGSLPAREPDRSVCLAALIWAAARCVAAPGHTAQPFQPTTTALASIAEAWSKDVVQIVKQVLPTIARLSAVTRGDVITDDATNVATKLTCDDLVFLDPPYSAAQYSRFYHVLETIARGQCSAVSGVGRYPPAAERPSSRFSLKGQALDALQILLDRLRMSECRIVMTFPQQRSSNGLSGESIVQAARGPFEVDITSVVARHSTLGGNNSARAARRSSQELIMVMRPRTRSRGRSRTRA
jgi:adenine-specific DNA-methyltransferase